MSQEEIEFISKGVDEEEIKRATFSLGDEKSPSPDVGFPLLFCQKFWYVIKIDLCNMVREVFVSKQGVSGLDHTCLVLTPKK